MSSSPLLQRLIQLEVGIEEVTFTVHFNRDMDQTVLPMVSFGPADLTPTSSSMVTGQDLAPGSAPTLSRPQQGMDISSSVWLMPVLLQTPG